MAEVTLTAAMRNNLTNLQQTAELMSQTQTRLSTGKRVNSALDNPLNYFAAAAHNLRASQLDARKDGMRETIQSITSANTGLEGLKTLIASAQGIAETARSTAPGGLTSLYTQFDSIASQMQQLVVDAGYKGTNLIGGSSVTLDVLFNETGTNKLTLQGFDGNVSTILSTNYGGIGTTLTTINGSTVSTKMTDISSLGGWTDASTINMVANALTAAVGQLGVQAANLASSLAIVNARLSFTDSVINNEKTGADNLTLADTNAEGANMLMLQTRNQLGTTALSLASQAAQSVLRLFP